jgi:hypothetical protein
MLKRPRSSEVKVIYLNVSPSGQLIEKYMIHNRSATGDRAVENNSLMGNLTRDVPGRLWDQRSEKEASHMDEPSKDQIPSQLQRLWLDDVADSGSCSDVP